MFGCQTNFYNEELFKLFDLMVADCIVVDEPFSREKWHQSLTFIAIVIAIIALPFSMAVCHAGLFVLVLNWIAEGKWARKGEVIQNNPLLWSFLFLFFLHIIGLLYSQDKANGLFNVEKKLAFFFVPIIIATSKIELRYFNFILKSFLVTCVAAALICLVIALNRIWQMDSTLTSNFDAITSENFKSMNSGALESWSIFSYTELSSAIGIHPTYLGLYVLFSLSILIHFYKESQGNLPVVKKIISLVLFAFLSLFLLMLSSRIIIIAYILICAFGLHWVYKGKIAALLSIGPVVIVSGLILINPVTRYRAFQELSQSNYKIEKNLIYTQSSTIRLSLWWLGIESIKENNWLTGVGTGDTIEVMRETGEQFNISNILNSYDPHNQFIYTTLSLGIVGLITLLICVFGPFVRYGFALPFLYFIFIGSIFLVCLTESFFELQKGIVFFSLFNSLFVLQFQQSQINDLTLSNV
jgi:O-antigen ligase